MVFNYSTKTLEDIQKHEHSEDLDAKRVHNIRNRITSFEELIVGQRSSKFNIKPTWGISSLRDTLTTNNGATGVEIDGEIKLSTGTNSNGNVELRTKERGQYQAGTEGEAGAGIRIPTLPTGNQFAEWGYFDDNNGFGFGVDSTGIYIFLLRSGVKTKTYQNGEDGGDPWNQDQANGTDDQMTNKSGVDLDLTIGNIFQLDFVWYGYGTIEYYLNVKEPAENRDKRVLIHSIQFEEGVSVIDPNQPINICVQNNGTSSNFDVYVGGRQFAIVDGISEPSTRDTPIIREAFTVSSSSYVPVMAVKKKTNFDGSGNNRTNSVRCVLKNVNVSTTEKLLWYADFGATVTNGTYGDVPNVPASETAVHVNTTLTPGGTTPNRAISRDVLLAGNQKAINQSRSDRIVIGQEDPLVIWMKRGGNSNAEVDLIVDIEEEW